MFLKKSLLALAFGFAAVGASAQTANINVSATVQAVCAISATNLAFGNYNSLSGTALQANSTLVVTCSQGSAPILALTAGANAAGVQRRMNLGAGYLNYGIYKPSGNAANDTCAYTTAWGDGTALGTTLTTTAAPDLTARTYNVCGEIPAGQSAAVGSYTDVVVASFTF